VHCSFAVLICCALAAPVLAQSSAATPSTVGASVATATPVNATKARKICRETVPTGSRLNAVKQCATAEEWERIYRETRETVERAQSRASIKDGPGGGS